MKTMRLLTLATACLLPFVSGAGTRSSANYSVPADTTDAGGSRTTSAAYTIDGSIGGIGGVGTVGAPATTAKHSYIGQLYEVTGLALTASPTNVNEGATRQLAAQAVLDDATALTITPASVGWSVLNGPVSSITPAGLATAANVYQDTVATVQGSYLTRVATLGLLVLNVGNDDFGSYAGDGLDDAWQVQYFGLNNPLAGPGQDPDADGQNNGYEHIVGSIPIDGTSYFRLRIERVSGQPTHRDLIFSPRVAGRTYTPQYKLGLDAPQFLDLGGTSTTDIGPTRTVTDLNAVESNKVYRVRISLP